MVLTASLKVQRLPTDEPLIWGLIQVPAAESGCLSDVSIGNAINVGGDEIDRLALALDLPEAPRKVQFVNPS